MTIDVTYKGTHILTESDLCDLIDERDALAATLNICPDHYEDCEWDWRNCSAANPNVCTCGWQDKKGNPKAILDAHDAALVEALAKYGVHLPLCGTVCSMYRQPPGEPECTCGLNAALAPYREKICQPEWSRPQCNHESHYQTGTAAYVCCPNCGAYVVPPASGLVPPERVPERRLGDTH